MAMLGDSQTRDVSHSRGNRAHARRRLLPIAYVHLGEDKGGILLNLSEGGFAVQSPLALTSREFPELRFQVPASQGWLMASGRIVWISESKKVAGIQFTELPGAARTQIHKWVSAEDSPEEIPERGNDRQAGSSDSRNQILGALAPGDKVSAQQPAIGSIAVSSRPRAPGETVRTVRNDAVAVAAPEPAARDFRFSHYSMFAADPEQEDIWIEPAKKRGSWASLTLLGIFLSALFFVLGATVGRGTVDQWLASVDAWKQGELVPATKPPSPPEPTDQGSAQVPDADDSRAGDAQQVGPQLPSAGASQNAVPAPNTEASELAGGGAQKEANNPQVAESRSGAAASAGPKGDRRSGTALSSRESRDDRHPSAYAETRGYDNATVETGRSSTERAILVNAPEPGSPPFVVNLPGDAVSASPAIAINARRSILIEPRNGSYRRSERVVIGKLVSHSQPFYPIEARSKGIEGSVELRLRIGRTGQVIGVTPIHGPSELMSAAVAAVREWRYEPTFLDGDPVETQADVTMVFRAR